MAIANTALPAISAGLQTGAATSVWVVNSCQLAELLRLRLAAMGDLWGPRLVLLRAWRWSRLAGLRDVAFRGRAVGGAVGTRPERCDGRLGWGFQFWAVEGELTVLKALADRPPDATGRA